jgi:hypothetical protein
MASLLLQEVKDFFVLLEELQVYYGNHPYQQGLDMH